MIETGILLPVAPVVTLVVKSTLGVAVVNPNVGVKTLDITDPGAAIDAPATGVESVAFDALTDILPGAMHVSRQIAC